MTRIIHKPIKPCASAEQSGDSTASHFEIEVKVGLKDKQEGKRVQK